MKHLKLLFMGLVIAFTGCATTPQFTQEDAAEAGKWIKDRSNYIQVAVMTATHVLVYSFEKDSEERAIVLSRLNVVASNINSLVSEGNVDPEALRLALKVNEEYIDGVLRGVAAIYKAEYQNVQNNGYGFLTVEVLKAVSKGIQDGTVTK